MMSNTYKVKQRTMLSEAQVLSRRKAYLVIGAFGLLFAGIIYAWAILKEPLAKEFNWNSSQLAFNYTLTLMVNCLGNLLAGVLSKKLPRQAIIAGSATLLMLGFTLSSGLTGDSIVKLYICYGCMCGLGIGTFTVAINGLVGDWFPEKKGLCSSILQIGFGSSALIIGGIADKFIHMPAVGWRKVYLALGLLTGLTLYLVAFLVKSPSPNAPLPETANAAPKVKASPGTAEIALGQMVRRRGFQKYYLFCFLIYCIGSTVIGLATDIFYGINASASTAVSLVGLISVFNLFGRFTVGIVFDKFGWRKVLLYAVTLAASGILLLTVSFAVRSIPVSAVAVCLIGASYGCIPSSTSPIIREAFGDRNFSSNYSVALTSAMPASFMATFAGMILTGGGSYYLIFAIFALFAAAAFALYINTKQL